MPELGTYGSVRGVPGNGHPYRDHKGERSGRLALFFVCARLGERLAQALDRRSQPEVVEGRRAQFDGEGTNVL